MLFCFVCPRNVIIPQLPETRAINLYMSVKDSNSSWTNQMRY